MCWGTNERERGQCVGGTAGLVVQHHTQLSCGSGVRAARQWASRRYASARRSGSQDGIVEFAGHCSLASPFRYCCFVLGYRATGTLVAFATGTFYTSTEDTILILTDPPSAAPNLTMQQPHTRGPSGGLQMFYTRAQHLGERESLRRTGLSSPSRTSRNPPHTSSAPPASGPQPHTLHPHSCTSVRKDRPPTPMQPVSPKDPGSSSLPKLQSGSPPVSVPFALCAAAPHAPRRLPRSVARRGEEADRLSPSKPTPPVTPLCTFQALVLHEPPMYGTDQMPSVESTARHARAGGALRVPRGGAPPAPPCGPTHATACRQLRSGAWVGRVSSHSHSAPVRLLARPPAVLPVRVPACAGRHQGLRMSAAWSHLGCCLQ